MKKPKYIIKRTTAEVEPFIEPQKNRINLSISMHSPRYNEKQQALICEGELVINLLRPKKDDKEEFGTIEVEMIIKLETPKVAIKEDLETWKEEEYEAVSKELVKKLESGILREIFVPYQLLLKQSYSSILPSPRFTRTREELEPQEEKDQ